MIEYTLKKVANPQVDDEVRYTAQMVPVNPVNEEDFAAMIADHCTVTQSDVRACLAAFTKHVTRYMRHGYTVKLEGFGTFWANIVQQTVKQLDKWEPSNIKGLKMVYRPDPLIMKYLKPNNPLLRFKRVGSL